MDRQDISEFFKKRPPLFWWMLANTLAITFAIGAWVICLNLFRDPTHPLSYEYMLKVGRIDPILAFTNEDDDTKLPKVKNIFDVTQLEQNFIGLSPQALASTNHQLITDYLTNYEKNRVPICITGHYKILETRPLDENDFITSGLVARTQAVVFPEEDALPLDYPVYLDIIFPTADDASTVMKQGKIIHLQKNPHFCVLLHVAPKEAEGSETLLFTALALHSTEYTSEEDASISFTIVPPEKANPAGKLPFF